MKFVNPQNDIAFKKIFGDEHHKDVLISFLNAVLGLEGDHEIADLTLLNPYQAPKIDVLKHTLLDVQALDRRGVTFIVEMQVEDSQGLRKRFQFYAAKSYAGQIAKGEDYPRLNQVIFIGILNFNEFASCHYLSRHLILNQETQTQELKDLEFNFIELPKFRKTEAELTTLLEKWVFFIKHAEDLQVIPHHADEVAALRHAYEAADQFGWSREEMAYYESSGMRRQNDRGVKEKAVQAARQEGREEGKVEGMLEASLAIARNLLTKMDDATIAEITGLSEAAIIELRRSIDE